MADVTGPISTLPGARHNVPEGATCDDCASEGKEVKAVVRLQGETDSFGSEMYDLCQACYDAQKDAPDEMADGCCQWCHKHATDLRPFRDADEGQAGPVYYVCGKCRARDSDKWAKEWAEMDRSHHHDY